jgi:hypothetical protein
MKMIKITTIAATLVLVAGCASIRGSANGDSVTTTVSAPRAQALEIARTQLVHHGFTVTGAGSDVLVTSPKPVPNYLREVSTEKQSSQRWFLVVQGTDVRFFRGTRLRVSGYLLPAGAGQVSAVTNGKRLEQSAIPITEQNARLFREVQAAANWIIAEANRKK